MKIKIEYKNFLIFLSGIFLLTCFFSLERSKVGFDIQFYGAGLESRGELNLWLAYMLFLTPGLIFLCYSFRRRITKIAAHIKSTIDELTTRDRVLLISFMCALTFIISRFGHYFILLGYPITDDEIGAKLGGQILASGKIMAEMWQPFSSYMHPFMYVKNGHYTSFECPGVLLIWALGDLLKDNSLSWAFVAAVPVVPIFLIAKRFLPPFWGFFSAILYFFSPQALTLSLTTHAHLLTRACLSISVLCFVIAYERKNDLGLYSLFGLITGIGLISRPYEIGLFLAPFYIFLAWEIFRGKLGAKVVLGVILGAAWPVLFFFWYNLHTTGRLFEIARQHPAYYDFSFPTYSQLQNKIHNPQPISLATIWRRFGGNLANNLLTLEIWFYAPLGFLLAILGVSTNMLTKLLASGIACTLALALFHDNYGVHLAGPINYSECIVALPILASFGIRNLSIWLKSLGLNSKEIIASLVPALLFGAIIFTAINWSALLKQATIHQDIYGYVTHTIEKIEEKVSTPRKVVILAKQYREYWWTDPVPMETGSYVYEWQIPNPNLLENIIYLRDSSSDLTELRNKFPDRDFYRLSLTSYPKYFSLDFLKP